MRSQKKVENHACAVALHAMYYNFVRIDQTLKVTPAMAAGEWSALGNERCGEPARSFRCGLRQRWRQGWPNDFGRLVIIWEESHGMVQPENIDSGHSNFQLDTRSGGYYRNLDYLLVYLALR
jgi:hypothetical protein